MSRLMTALQKDFTDWVFRNTDSRCPCKPGAESLWRTRCQPGGIHEGLRRSRP
ncbi:MAG: hypothetical protein MZV64_17915 [Ignavibacteriales bacterium]|nr:hypothetical protein [Ignavibacteriales bacterium]